MEEYKPNSHKSKEARREITPDKKIEKVVTGEVVTRKKGMMQKFAEALISDDASSVRSYILMDVLVPAAKKAISDVVTNGVDMILYGEAGRNRRNNNATKVSYRSYYEHDNDRREQRDKNRNRGAAYSYDDVVLSTRGEAEEVLLRMNELIDTYGLVSVADLYDLVGITGNYTDNKYGWTSLRTAEPVWVRYGYMLKLPRALPLD